MVISNAHFLQVALIFDILAYGFLMQFFLFLFFSRGGCGGWGGGRGLPFEL